MSTATRHDYKELPKSYAALVEILPPRPIHSRQELEGVREMVDTLAVRPRLPKDQADYLQALTLFIEAYEDEHAAMEDSFDSPLAALKHLVESSGMTRAGLGELLGDRSLGTRILNGERDLSKAHIVKLCDHFQVTPEMFLKISGA